MDMTHEEYHQLVNRIERIEKMQHRLHDSQLHMHTVLHFIAEGVCKLASGGMSADEVKAATAQVNAIGQKLEGIKATPPPPPPH